MSSQNTSSLIALMQEMLRNDRNQQRNQQNIRQYYENISKSLGDYQHVMMDYQNNMQMYLLLMTSLQLQLSSSSSSSNRTENTPVRPAFSRGGNHRNTSFRPVPTYMDPPPITTTTQPTSRASEPFATSNDTRRLFNSLMRSDISGGVATGGGGVNMGGRVATRSASDPAVNLIDVVFEYEADSPLNIDTAAVQHLIDNDDFRNSILRAAGIENSNHVMHWVSGPQYMNSTAEEPRGLTNEEIRRNTESLIFSEELSGLLSNTCPITMEEYVAGDRLLQLHTCRHAFRERELVEWFQRERTCPVCRTQYS